VVISHTYRETWYWNFPDEGVGEVAQTAKRTREKEVGKEVLGTQ
jgi:hypothetical protein